MEILKDRETWLEVANELCEISVGADERYEDMPDGTIQKAFVAQQTDRILTIIALKVFPKYLEKMKKELTENK